MSRRKLLPTEERLALLEKGQDRAEIREYTLYAIAIALLVAVAWIGADQLHQADRSRAAISQEVRDRSAAEQRSITATKREGTTRREQLCDLFNRRDERNRRSLKATLRYVSQLSPAERKTSLNRTIIRALPQTRADVKADTPPPFCRPHAPKVPPRNSAQRHRLTP